MDQQLHRTFEQCNEAFQWRILLARCTPSAVGYHDDGKRKSIKTCQQSNGSFQWRIPLVRLQCIPSAVCYCITSHILIVFQWRIPLGRCTPSAVGYHDDGKQLQSKLANNQTDHFSGAFHWCDSGAHPVRTVTMTTANINQLSSFISLSFFFFYLQLMKFHGRIPLARLQCTSRTVTTTTAVKHDEINNPFASI